MTARALDLALWRKLMEHRKLRQSDLAREAHVSRQMVNMLLKGSRPGCTPAVAASIENALRVSHGTLFAYGPETGKAA